MYLLIFGKVFKDLLTGDILSETFLFGPLLVGFIAAFFTGIIACKLMIKLVKASKLKVLFVLLLYYSFVNYYLENNMKKNPFVEGALLIIDKPLNWTSFDIVKKIRSEIIQHFKIKIKVGHAGTLDPLATGVFVVCTGKKTKTLNDYLIDSKTYQGEIKLGATTPSYDLETPINKRYKLPKLTLELLNELKKVYWRTKTNSTNVLGKRVNGKRAYEFARKNENIDLKPSIINIYSLEFKIIKKDTLEFKCHCSKGTYIRSLARDIGVSLKSGGHLTSLKRIKSGNFTIDMAKSIEEWIDIIKTS